MTGIRRMPCIQTFIVRQRVIGELPDSIHNVVPKRADIGQITMNIGSSFRIGLNYISISREKLDRWCSGGPAEERCRNRVECAVACRSRPARAEAIRFWNTATSRKLLRFATLAKASTELSGLEQLPNE